jgi:DNA polymerase III subunit chi
MASVQFYQLTTTPLERALPKLLEKAFAGGFKTLVVAESDERVEQLNQLLWTYDPGSFLPHGSVKDGQSNIQPILISTRQEPLNEANMLFLIDGNVASETDKFERILDMFDGRDPQAVESARERWKTYKDLGNTVAYFLQTTSGGWEQRS